VTQTVLMLVINPMTSDTRVEKEAASLAVAGYDVTVIATAADGLPRREIRDGYTIVRVPYRRATKNAIITKWRSSLVRARDNTEALRLLSGGAGASGRAGFLIHIRLRWVRLALVLARIRWLLGAAMLKGLRSRVLPHDYWKSIASIALRTVDPPCAIHAHDLGTLAAAVRLAAAWERETSQRPPVLYDSHELYVEQLTRWSRREKWLWRRHERRWVGDADLVVTVSAGIAEELHRRYRLRREPVVILNTPPSTAPSTSGRDVRSEIQLSSDSRLMVYAGTVKTGRGCEVLVDVLAQDERWHLALVGPGSRHEVDVLVQKARRLGCSSRLHLVEAVPAAQLPGYLRTADVGVHPLVANCLNHELALPNKLFDYLFAGLPVVVSDLVEMGSFVRGHSVGFTFDGTTEHAPAALATALEQAHLARPDTAVVQQLVDQYGWTRQEQVLVDAYASLMRMGKNEA
jgi:glycosyltransferase involved in cell wall biosynthesis